MKKNKIIPLRESDIKRMKLEATQEAIYRAYNIFLIVMHDKEGYGTKRLKRVYDSINDISDSIAKGYVKYSDIEATLKEELGILLK